MSQRHPNDYANFPMIDERARNYILPDRAHAGLLVSGPSGRFACTHMTDLPTIVSAKTTLVLNTSGTFLAKIPEARLAQGTDAIYFAQMLDEQMMNWVCVIPGKTNPGEIINLPGNASIRVIEPYRINGVHAAWERGRLWIVQYQSTLPFEEWNLTVGKPIQYSYDTIDWQPDDLQNCYAKRRTSAMMNNGGRNLTMPLLQALIHKGVRIAYLEMRTGVGIDHYGIPLPEFVHLDQENAATINDAIARGDAILPVGTGVVRALDWFYDKERGQVTAGSGWCSNLITPDSGTWLKSWLSGLHEPLSTHLAMGSAIMGELHMRQAMIEAYESGMLFHENGDSHLYLPYF